MAKVHTERKPQEVCRWEGSNEPVTIKLGEQLVAHAKSFMYCMQVPVSTPHPSSERTQLLDRLASFT